MFLGGSAGTGKSRVIEAFSNFVDRWMSTPAIVISATAGIAAVQIGGCTLHCALGVQLNMHPPDPSASQIDAWSEVGVLFVDELSMMKQDLMALLDIRLRKLKGRMNVKFGGIHVVFCGDFYQLPPVMGVSLYAIPKRRGRSLTNQSYLAEQHGYHIWISYLTDAILLKRNHRQTDPLWAAMLERFRINQPRREDLEAVNSRYKGKVGKDAAAVVPTNEDREAGLKICENDLLQHGAIFEEDDLDWHARGVLYIQADVYFGRLKAEISTIDQQTIRNSDSAKLDAVGNLLCVFGGLYLVKTNSDISKGVANGTLAALLDVILHDDVKPHIIHLSNSTSVYAVYAKQVKCLILKHTMGVWAKKQLFPTLPVGCFPIVPQKCLPHFTFSGKSRPVNVFQFATVLASILTGHRVQGQSLNALILGAISKDYEFGKHGWLYVILARVRTLLGLSMMVKLSTNPALYKPRTDVLREMQRLSCIESNTKARLGYNFSH